MAVLPVLPVSDVSEAIDHYVGQLGFSEEFRVPGENDTPATGQVVRGDNRIMFNLNPQDASNNGGGIWLWIRIDGEDIDGFYETVQSSTSIEIVEEIGDRFWGDRSFAIRDALGYTLAFNAKINRSEG